MYTWMFARNFFMHTNFVNIFPQLNLLNYVFHVNAYVYMYVCSYTAESYVTQSCVSGQERHVCIPRDQCVIYVCDTSSRQFAYIS